MRRALAVISISALPACALADVYLLERTSTIYASNTAPNGYNDSAVATGPGPSNLVSHNRTFNSNVTDTAFSASMNAGRNQTGPTGGSTVTAASGTLSFRFIITQTPELFSITINDGSLFPVYSVAQSATSLRLTSVANGQVIYDLFRQTPPPSMNGLPTWTNAHWSTLLAPGEYILQATIAGGSIYNVGPGQGGFSTASLNFSGTITPTPAASTVLLCGALAATNRRRNGRQ